jgi:hypothetical protein
LSVDPVTFSSIGAVPPLPVKKTTTPSACVTFGTMPTGFMEAYVKLRLSALGQLSSCPPKQFITYTCWVAGFRYLYQPLDEHTIGSLTNTVPSDKDPCAWAWVGDRVKAITASVETSRSLAAIVMVEPRLIERSGLGL